MLELLVRQQPWTQVDLAGLVGELIARVSGDVLDETQAIDLPDNVDEQVGLVATVEVFFLASLLVPLVELPVVTLLARLHHHQPQHEEAHGAGPPRALGD